MHVYILSPDATAFDSISVNGLNVENLTAILERTARKLEIKPGGPVVKPSPQSVPPLHPPDSLVFHLIARGFNVGSYREFPSENWIILSRDEGKSILPDGAVHPGLTWDIERQVAFKWLTTFYPQGIDTGAAERSRIDQHSLKATVISIEDGVACARIDGKLLMKRSFSPGRDDNNFVRATLLGFINFEPETRSVRTLRLVTIKATYGSGANDEGFAAALRSMSPTALQQYMGQP